MQYVSAQCALSCYSEASHQSGHQLDCVRDTQDEETVEEEDTMPHCDSNQACTYSACATNKCTCLIGEEKVVEEAINTV